MHHVSMIVSDIEDLQIEKEHTRDTLHANGIWFGLLTEEINLTPIILL